MGIRRPKLTAIQSSSSDLKLAQTDQTIEFSGKLRGTRSNARDKILTFIGGSIDFFKKTVPDASSQECMPSIFLQVEI